MGGRATAVLLTLLGRLQQAESEQPGRLGGELRTCFIRATSHVRSGLLVGVFALFFLENTVLRQNSINRGLNVSLSTYI